MPAIRVNTGWMALFSGFLGATASCFAKFAFDPDSIVALQTQALCDAGVDLPDVAGQSACYWIAIIGARGICLSCMIVCNAYMLGTFLKGMEESGSVAGTALSTASNFAMSACYGYLLWGERFSVLWWTGFSMVVAGVMLLTGAYSGESRPKRD